MDLANLGSFVCNISCVFRFHGIPLKMWVLFSCEWNLPQTEALLQEQFSQDPYVMALLFIEMAKYRVEAEEQAELLARAVHSIQAAEANEEALLRRGLMCFSSP